LSVKAADTEQPRVRTRTRPWGTQVVLDAPQVRNALDPASVVALHDVFATDDPGAVLLSARGPAFCAGGDLSVLSSAAAVGDLAGLLTSRAAAFADLVEAMVACPRPVVVALDGPAVGGGVSLALACDVRLATPAARFVLGWAHWGLPPDGGAAALLAAVVGAETAQVLLAEAADIGVDSPLASQVFTRVVEPPELAAAAIDTVSALAASPTARAEKAVARAPLLAALRAGRDAELAALERAAGDPTVVARLANVYKMEK
jgi:enoyl-CoA hydratase/carnithine racemase